MAQKGVQSFGAAQILDMTSGLGDTRKFYDKMDMQGLLFKKRQEQQDKRDRQAHSRSMILAGGDVDARAQDYLDGTFQRELDNLGSIEGGASGQDYAIAQRNIVAAKNAGNQFYKQSDTQSEELQKEGVDAKEMHQDFLASQGDIDYSMAVSEGGYSPREVTQMPFASGYFRNYDVIKGFVDKAEDSQIGYVDEDGASKVMSIKNMYTFGPGNRPMAKRAPDGTLDNEVFRAAIESDDKIARIAEDAVMMNGLQQTLSQSGMELSDQNIDDARRTYWAGMNAEEGSEERTFFDNVNQNVESIPDLQKDAIRKQTVATELDRYAHGNRTIKEAQDKSGANFTFNNGGYYNGKKLVVNSSGVQEIETTIAGSGDTMDKKNIVKGQGIALGGKKTILPSDEGEGFIVKEMMVADDGHSIYIKGDIATSKGASSGATGNKLVQDVTENSAKYNFKETGWVKATPNQLSLIAVDRNIPVQGNSPIGTWQSIAEGIKGSEQKKEPSPESSGGGYQPI